MQRFDENGNFVNLPPIVEEEAEESPYFTLQQYLNYKQI
jgi:hypothetical protein